MKRAILRAIRFYQASVSPLFPPRCRYIPTCSEYALQAVEKYGRCGAALWRCGAFCDAIPSTKAGMILFPENLVFPTQQKTEVTTPCLQSSDTISVCPLPS